MVCILSLWLTADAVNQARPVHSEGGGPVATKIEILPLPLMARNGPVGPVRRRPFIGVKRTRERLSISEFDPQRTLFRSFQATCRPHDEPGRVHAPRRSLGQTARRGQMSLRAEGIRLGMVRRSDGGARLLDPGVGGRRTYFRLRPLNELCRSTTSAKKVGSTHVAFGFLIGFVSLDFGLTTVSSCFLIWLETVRDQPVPTLPM